MAEADKVAVPGLPVLYRQDSAQFHFAFKWSFCVYEPQIVADAMNMDIDADGRQVEADGYRKVGGFASDAWKSAEFLDSLRQYAAEFFPEYFR